MNKKFFLFFFLLLIGIGLFSWVIKFVGWPEIKSAFLVFTFWQGIIILILTLTKALTATWKWKEILKVGGTNVPFFGLFKSHLAGFSVMYLFPTFFLGGEILQSYILKKKYRIPWSKGMASSITDQILDWTTNLVVIFFGIILFILRITLLPKKMAILFFVVISFSLLVVSYFYFKAFRKESIINFLFRRLNYNKKGNGEPLEVEKEIFNFFDLKKFSFRKGIFLAFFEEAIFLLRVWFLVSFFGRNIDFFSTLSILGFSYLALMIPIPATFGIHEGIQAFTFNALKLGIGLGTAFTMIIRGADLIVAFIGLFIFLKLGSELLKPLFKNERNFRQTKSSSYCSGL